MNMINTRKKTIFLVTSINGQFIFTFSVSISMSPPQDISPSLAIQSQAGFSIPLLVSFTILRILEILLHPFAWSSVGSHPEHCYIPTLYGVWHGSIPKVLLKQIRKMEF